MQTKYINPIDYGLDFDPLMSGVVPKFSLFINKLHLKKH